MKCLYIDDNRTEKAAADAIFYNIAKEFPDGSMAGKKIVRYSGRCGVSEQIMQAVDRICGEIRGMELNYIIVHCASYGAEYAGRLAGRLHMDCVSNVEKIRCRDGQVWVTIPVYNGNLLCEKNISARNTVIAIRASAFEAPEDDGAEYTAGAGMARRISGFEDTGEAVTQIISVDPPGLSQAVRFDVIPLKEEDDNMKNADRVVVLGHGFRSEAQVGEAVKFAGRTGAALGGSRPVIIDGLLPVSRLVGMSGSSIHAKKCLLMGVSGASAFLEGIKYCGHIIAVNKDQDAAVFKASHQGVIGDCHEILRTMNQLLEDENGCNEISD